MKIESIIQDQILDDNIIATSLPFLQGDGEMAELTRKYDWASTILGDPESWCSTLKSFVSTVLLSKSPMFLWWGNDLIQFYNDAYRSSLGKEGEGKHPLALGQCGKDCWPEIWPTIKPLIDHVIQKKEGVWNEDLLVPIFRNGGIEDVYWSFGYTPVLEEDGNVGGVLVTCQETTQKVNMLRKLKESDDRFKNLIRDSTVGIIVLEGESFVVKVVNDIYCTLIQKNYEDVIGQCIFDI